MRILLADDDADSRESVADFLRQAGHNVVEAQNGTEALTFYRDDSFEMVLTDLRMPKLSGIGLLREIRQIDRNPAPDVVVFTGQGDMESAIEALRYGAYDFVLKPLNVEELAAITARIAEHQALLKENQTLRRSLKKIARESAGLNSAGFFSPEMKRIAEQAMQYHKDRLIPVLIQGETGTGKEIISRLIHFGEEGSEAPFVEINCAAITAGLFESELFGYEGGSFTGGRSQGQKGKFDLAAGGTLLLDEIGELPVELQAKLLRVIEAREFFRVGGLTKVRTDIRLIGATNQDLAEKVKKGQFRSDLYYRLRVGLLEIPPLRERPEDILGLAGVFLARFCQAKKKKFRRLAEETKEKLLRHSWPGNVRELHNAIEWAVFMHDGPELKPEHLPADINGPVSRSQPFEEKTELVVGKSFSLDATIHQIVRKALELNGGNKKQTAEYLQISRRTLYTYLAHINGNQQDEPESVKADKSGRNP